jgi:hypothetical protein
MMAANALGSDVDGGFLHGKMVYLIHADGRLEPFAGELEAARDVDDPLMDLEGAAVDGA